MSAKLAIAVTVFWYAVCNFASCGEPKIVPLPEEYRVGESRIVGRPPVPGYRLGDNCWLPEQKQLVCMLVLGVTTGEAFGTSVKPEIEPKDIGLVAISIDSGKALLLDLSQCFEPADGCSPQFGRPFAFDDHSCGVAVWRKHPPTNEDEEIFPVVTLDGLWVWDLQDNRVRKIDEIDKWDAKLEHFQEIIDAKRCSVSWSPVGTEKDNGIVKIRNHDTGKAITLRFGNSESDGKSDSNDVSCWDERFLPADDRQAFVGASEENRSITCVDFSSPKGIRWKLNSEDIAGLVGSPNFSMMNFRVFVGRTLGTTFPIVVETSRESRTGVERWLELLRLDIQTGKLVSRSSYRLDSTPGKDMMTDTFTLLVATDGKKAFLIVSRPEGRPFEENGIRGIEGISHISLDSIDLESGVRKQIFSDRKDLWYLESNPIIGYCDKTSEILLDADSIIGVKVSPDPTVRTIFEMRRDSATSEPKDSSQGP